MVTSWLPFLLPLHFHLPTPVLSVLVFIDTWSPWVLPPHHPPTTQVGLELFWGPSFQDGFLWHPFFGFFQSLAGSNLGCCCQIFLAIFLHQPLCSCNPLFLFAGFLQSLLLFGVVLQIGLMLGPHRLLFSSCHRFFQILCCLVLIPRCFLSCSLHFLMQSHLW